MDQEDPDIEAYLDRSLVEAESLVGGTVPVRRSSSGRRACQAHEAGGAQAFAIIDAATAAGSE